jgi:tRNA dimethylallyltransferase
MALSTRLVALVVALPSPAQDPLALLILGPTGSGKTALSLALARQFRGEIVSCDSVAVYRGMDIGSAKPSLEERAQVPHHLIDIANPDQAFTAGDYSRQSRAALHEIALRNHLPIVTGGTGLYLRALTEGLHPVPVRHRQTRASLTQGHNEHGPGWLHSRLAELDPEAATRIHPNDTPKLIRALEILMTTGQPLAINFAAPKDPLTGFRLLRIGLNPPRKDLYARLNQRAEAMFHAGLVEETRSLLARYGRVPALDSLGYRQALAVIDGTASEPEAIAQAQQGHRNYAKRQLTWFRREPDVHWIDDFGNTPATFQRAVELVTHSRPV